MARTSDETALRLINAAAGITSAPAKADIVYMVRHFIQATLPHRDPGPVPVWRKHNGRLTLTVTPYRDETGQPRYPFGSIPRLLLFWIVTEAVRNKSRRLELGRSLADFMRLVGLNPETGGGKRGDAHRLRQQMVWLFRAQISISESEEAWINMPLTEGGQVWWSHAAPNQQSLFGSFIILGETFFRAILASSVPVDRRALHGLRRSPLALDFYAWATYRVFTLSGRGCFIPWTRLSQQFGADYADSSNFQKAAVRSLRRVALFYGGLRYRIERGGVRLLPSLPAITPCGSLPFIHGETVRPAKPRPRKASLTYPPKPTVKRYE